MPRKATALPVSGDKVVRLRYERGLTTEELAARSELHVNTIYKAEASGHLVPNTLAKLAEALGVEIEAILDSHRRHTVKLRFHLAGSEQKQQLLELIEREFPDVEVFDVETGSILLTLKISGADLARLVQRVEQDDLARFDPEVGLVASTTAGEVQAREIGFVKTFCYDLKVLLIRVRSGRETPELDMFLSSFLTAGQLLDGAFADDVLASLNREVCGLARRCRAIIDAYRSSHSPSEPSTHVFHTDLTLCINEAERLRREVVSYRMRKNT